ncbi:D-aminoacyl-tRNA deacylase [Salidesulfovibrio onnuriiensis]|uniref:D-aminoacyl-tRNA deacylase n=1 Tax=Salidesulfovibrio onnuriiensis TaxID=2583823 RepID=UPI0011CAC5FD|nr:D-aminoacyl-tRNA deacylase [Salidesulfovibrio onnuriiensis]
MRLVIQRVTDARVIVDQKTVAETEAGFLALVGFGREDREDLPASKQWSRMLDKLMNLRVFTDDDGKFNLSLKDVRGDLLLVSQFTLYADCKKGRRPSFTDACPPELANTLFERFVSDARTLAPARVETGVFGAEMFLDFTNWGPVTITLDSKDL